jgi:hypothetical protein
MRELDSTSFPSGFTIAGLGPIVATAIHDGHAVRPELLSIMKINEADRLREEDPFTGLWTDVGDVRVIVERSRFEVDVNRPREKAVYLASGDAWGLDVWATRPSSAELSVSLAHYDAFYSSMNALFVRLEREFGAFVVLDLHTYNHMRLGRDGPADDPRGNPEVNVGTGNTDRERWASLIERFMGELAGFDFGGRHLDVRENVKFTGGHFSRWIHSRFPRTSCVLAIEFKKFFMDEWTGTPDRAMLSLIREALKTTIPGLREELSAAGRRGGRG